MKVEWPRARSSAAPTRENSRSTTPIWAARAGTKLPIWARTAISAFWRRKVDLPAIFGPVINQMRPAVASTGGERTIRGGGDDRPAGGGERLFDNRVTAALDQERKTAIDDGAHIIALHRER